MGDPPERAPGFLREARLSRGGDHSGSRGGREVQPVRLSQKRDFGLWNDDHRSSSTYSDIALVCGSVRPRGVWTTAINLGAALAERGRRVLLVDMDPQGALSVGLGLNPLSLEKTLYNLLMDSDQDAGPVVTSTKIDRVDLLPSNIDLAAAEVLLVGEVAREQALARVLRSLRRRYDFLLVDCPPSLGLLTVNALTAADGVLIPLECEYFALRGMALLMDTISKIADRLNPDLKIVGVLATMYDARTVHGREVLGRVEEAFSDRVFKTVVGKTIRFAEAPVAGESILTYAGDSPGAAAYRELAKEVLAS